MLNWQHTFLRKWLMIILKIALDIPDKQISKWRKYSKNRQSFSNPKTTLITRIMALIQLLSICYQEALKVLQTRINAGFTKHFCLFKLAKFGLILVVLTHLSIPSCIDNQYLFHSLFFVLHIFSTNPVPLLYCHYCV